MLVGEMRFAENLRESAGCRYRNENLLAAVALTGYVHRALDRTALNMARLKCFDSLATTVYILGGISACRRTRYTPNAITAASTIETPNGVRFARDRRKP